MQCLYRGHGLLVFNRLRFASLAHSGRHHDDDADRLAVSMVEQKRACHFVIKSRIQHILVRISARNSSTCITAKRLTFFNLQSSDDRIFWHPQVPPAPRSESISTYPRLRYLPPPVRAMTSYFVSKPPPLPGSNVRLQDLKA